MKRRILSFLLCVVMILTGIFATACGKTTDEEAETETGEGESTLARSSMTLTLWIPVEEGTTEESLELVEEAINKITQSKFDTAIKLYGIATDEYEEAVQKQMADIQERIDKADQAALDRVKAEREAAKRGETLGPEWYTNAIETLENPYDLIVDSAAGYPHVENNQMDIFLVRGFEDYKNYIENSLVVSLDEELIGTSKKLTSYIYPHFFTAARAVDGAVYAIPNNRAIGEYKWLVTNGELAEELGYTSKDLANFGTRTQNFVEAVAEKYPDVTTVYGNIPTRYMQYWSDGATDDFSVLASYVSGSATVDTVEIGNLFDIKEYTDAIYYDKLYTEKGYINNKIDPLKDKFGMAIIEASAEEIKQYEELGYYCSVYEYPVASVEECCKSMFAVSTYTKSSSRAMEILTYLNTEEDSLRTILQYGVEGEHWKYDEANPNMIVQLADTYNVNIEETGNSYMTYPDYGVEVDFSEPITNWVGAKEANKNSIYPVTSGLTGYAHEENAELIAELNKLNDSISKKIEKMGAEEFKKNIESLRKQVGENDAFEKLVYVPAGNDINVGRTPENGWIPENSIVYMWQQYVASLTA